MRLTGTSTRTPGNPLAGVVALLAEFGALTGDARKPVITTLGRWAAGHLPVGLPALADPGLPAGEMIAAAAQFSDAEQQDHVAWGWLAERDAAAAAREILTAAGELPPLLRGVAVRGRTAGGGRAAGLARAGGGTARRPARPRRAGGLGPGPRARRRNWRWLGVEAAAAALADKGPDEALSRVWESMPERAPTPGLRPCGPPATRTRGQSLGRWRSSPRPARSIDQVAELKVSLAGARPPIWRRVGLPATATLADLHETIQVLFSWDGDHLHVFAVGKKQYGDPFADLEGAGDDGEVRVQDALARGARKITYTYDVGACWEHEITLEKTLERDPGRDYPVCVEFKGGSPVEYWSEDQPEEPRPFSLATVNRRLHALGEEG